MKYMRCTGIVLALLLGGCIDAEVTWEQVEDAQRMCDTQGGVRWILKRVNWMEVRCNNGMSFMQGLHQFAPTHDGDKQITVE